MKRSPEPRTIGEALDACRDRLRRVSDTPWLDARLLAQHVTGLDASALIAYGDARLERARRQQLFQLVERRAAGEPVAYLVGKKSFCGLELRVDKRVLVPRPETEALVAACVDNWAGLDATIADVGTGSGAVACALAHMLPHAGIVAIDASEAALQVAVENANALGLSEQISFMRSDVFADLPAELRFDAIVANLPYVSENRLDQLSPDVQAYEPRQALLGGRDGLNVYRQLFNEAPGRLKDRGTVYCECAPDNARALQAIAQHAFPHASVEVRTDLAGLERMVVCRVPQPNP